MDALNVSNANGSAGLLHAVGEAAQGSHQNQTQRNVSCPTRQQVSDLAVSLRIALYSAIFLLSVVGNGMIIAVLACNRRMRTVTNVFLLSLAVSDLLLVLFCMPFTLVPNLMKDFIFGEMVCRAVAYLMGLSVSVSTFSLVAISIERYGAICNPLASRVWQTRSHAQRVIAVTWSLSMLLMIPYAAFYDLLVFTKRDGTTGQMCRMALTNVALQQAWQLFLLVALFLLPGLIMMVAYGLISWELYKGIKFESRQRRETEEIKQGARYASGSDGYSDGGDDGDGDGDGCYVSPSRSAIEMGNLQQQQQTSLAHRNPSLNKSTRRSGENADCGSKPIDRARSTASEANLLAKKRVIRMLITIVVMFFICWTPVFSANAWRAFDKCRASQVLSGAPISFIHLMSYASACLNPIIYCFMNKRFRQACTATISRCCASVCCSPKGAAKGARCTHGGTPSGKWPDLREPRGIVARGRTWVWDLRSWGTRGGGVRLEASGEEDGTGTSASMSRYTYTTVSTVG
ncbi:cholecystokinin receptor type A isoform X1 [Petromyzon marinus]|uniref:Gastrin/cholecystokinin type B receptor n=1 Tax=Petromyzon marinus TaxID=7757 RepID=A0AAJ7U4J3_PETMA|nr:cholecystokinin receptor type A-like isoform X1 [Petromyzon marinus]XP_032828153.1 cholecystokinin receptor type A-like isoform X1 [Petromyzon marinus]